MHVMIFGARGKVGSALVDRFSRTQDHITALTRDDCDLLSPMVAVRWIQTQKPDVVINATAMNGMEQCDQDPHLAYLINAAAPLVMAQETANVGGLFIHYSTDYVFSGSSKFSALQEASFGAPSGRYGYSKAQGENAVQWAATPSFTFRLSSVWGNRLEGMLGVLKQAMNGKGTAADPIKVLHQWCAPTSAWLIADATAHVVESLARDSWPTGPEIYHLATSEPVWKVDHARWLLDTVLGEGYVVEEGSLAVKRPEYSFLASYRFAETFHYPLPDWRQDLAANIGWVRDLL